MENIGEIKIGQQIWMVENLNISNFKNGELIKEAQSDSDWLDSLNKKEPAWCYYKQDEKHEKKYGKLYNEFVLADERGLLDGWCLPNDEDWNELCHSIGGNSSAGVHLKSEKGWKKNGNGINDIGFNAKPGGGRFDRGTFMSEKARAHFWSCSKDIDDRFSFVFVMEGLDSLNLIQGSSRGYSIRLLKRL